MENKENIKREELTNRLNEFKGDTILSAFNEHLNGGLDDHVDHVLAEWTNEEFDVRLGY